MQLTYGLLVNFIIAFAMLKFYSKLQDQEIRKSTLFIIPIAYTLYRVFTTDIAIDPFRLLLSPIFIVVMLAVFREKISWVFLITSFLLTQALWLIVYLVSAITLIPFIIFGVELNHIAALLIGVPWSIIIFYGVFLLDKRQKINLSAYGKLLEHSFVRKMVWTIGILIVILYSFIHISADLQPASDFETSVVILALFIAVIVIIVFLTIFNVIHLNNEKKKRDWLEAENVRLEQERLAIQNQLSDLSDVHDQLQIDFGDVTSNHHRYRYVVPVLMQMQRELIEDIQYFSDYGHEEKMTQIKNYTDQIRLLSFGITDDFVADHIKSDLEALNIPAERRKLVVLLEKLMNRAYDNEVYLAIYNHGNLWHELDVPDAIFLRLLSNLVDNAIKESRKVPPEDRGDVQLIFTDDDEYFAFEVRDFAPEFEISILENLGKRNNSTNGTGDGYFEIIQALDEVNASIAISEWRRNGKYGKSIMVTFDSYAMKFIDSHYREDLLVERLKESCLEVMEAHSIPELKNL